MSLIVFVRKGSAPPSGVNHFVANSFAFWTGALCPTLLAATAPPRDAARSEINFAVLCTEVIPPAILAPCVRPMIAESKATLNAPPSTPRLNLFRKMRPALSSSESPRCTSVCKTSKASGKKPIDSESVGRPSGLNMNSTPAV